MAEYTAEDYIWFIETNRNDKISPTALKIIAKKFRELENTIRELKSEESDDTIRDLNI